MRLSMGGDLEGFMRAWDTCIQAMGAQPDIHMLRALFGNQLRKCDDLKLMFMTIEG